MKILFVHAIGRTKFGGGERWVISAAHGLKKRGHTVYLGCRPDSLLQKRAEERNITVRGFNIISDVSPYNIIRIASFLKNENIDVVLSKNRDFTVAGIAARIAGTPVVIARHGLPLRYNITRHKYLLKKFANGIIVNAFSTKDMYAEKGWFDNSFVKVIYNGIDLDTTCDPMPFDTMYPGKINIVSVGRLSSQKGFSYLIDAAAQLKKERDDFMIHILGDGKLRESLLERARSKGVEKNVQLPGFVKSVGPYLKGSDIFVLPSLFEGLSNAAIEAMACGRPAVLTDVNGSREIVTDGVNGFIIPPRDATALAGALNKLLSDENKRNQFGRKAEIHVKERFSIETMIDNLEQYFEEKLLEVIQ